MVVVKKKKKLKKKGNQILTLGESSVA